MDRTETSKSRFSGGYVVDVGALVSKQFLKNHSGALLTTFVSGGVLTLKGTETASTRKMFNMVGLEVVADGHPATSYFQRALAKQNKPH